MEEELKEQCFEQRKAIEEVKIVVRQMMDHGDVNGRGGFVKSAESEAKANIMLAYRHLEDARMRLGKCVQSLDGGTSCYPQ